MQQYLAWLQRGGAPCCQSNSHQEDSCFCVLFRWIWRLVLLHKDTFSGPVGWPLFTSHLPPNNTTSTKPFCSLQTSSWTPWLLGKSVVRMGFSCFVSFKTMKWFSFFGGLCDLFLECSSLIVPAWCFWTRNNRDSGVRKLDYNTRARLMDSKAYQFYFSKF